MAETPYARVARLQKELLEAEVRLVEENKKTPEIRLADFLHESSCHWNHVDGCGWFYEKNEDYTKSGTARNRFYQKAVKLLEQDSIDTIMRVFTTFWEK